MPRAAGREPRTFLDHLGYNRPAQDHIDVRLTYTSQLLRLPPRAFKERIVIISPAPTRPRGMALFAYENDTWLFTAIGLAGHEAPSELTEMLAFVQDFAPRHVIGRRYRPPPATRTGRPSPHAL